MRLQALTLFWKIAKRSLRHVWTSKKRGAGGRDWILNFSLLSYLELGKMLRLVNIVDMVGEACQPDLCRCFKDRGKGKILSSLASGSGGALLAP